MSNTESLLFEWAKYAATFLKKKDDTVEIWLMHDKWVLVVYKLKNPPKVYFNIPVLTYQECLQPL